MNLQSNDFELFGVPALCSRPGALDARWKELRKSPPRQICGARSRSPAGGDAVVSAHQRGVPAPERSAAARSLPVRAPWGAYPGPRQHRHAPAFLMQQMEWREAWKMPQPRLLWMPWKMKSWARKAGLAQCEALIDQQRRLPGGRAAGREPSCSLRDLPTTSIADASNWDNSSCYLSTANRSTRQGHSRRTQEFHGAFADLRARTVPDPIQRRIAVGIDLGTTHSWWQPFATAWLNACPTAKDACYSPP